MLVEIQIGSFSLLFLHVFDRMMIFGGRKFLVPIICNFFLNYGSFLRIFMGGYGKVAKLMKIFCYFDPIYQNGDEFHFEISVTSQPF